MLLKPNHSFFYKEAAHALACIVVHGNGKPSELNQLHGYLFEVLRHLKGDPLCPISWSRHFQKVFSRFKLHALDELGLYVKDLNVGVLGFRVDKKSGPHKPPLRCFSRIVGLDKRLKVLEASLNFPSCIT